MRSGNQFLPPKKALWRGDVEGLRGIAVLAVLIFHASAVALPGGFAGVDVFFVISGFVVGRNLLADFAAGRFSFADFYGRRARRLFPGLIVVLLATLVAAPFFVSMADYRELGRQIAAACVFAANFLAWSQAGYFDGDAAYRPLIHLWSLGVEEQFYLFFPLLLLAVHRLKPAALGPVLRLSVVLSFLACAILTEVDADAAFYLPVTRFWELLAGATLAYWNMASTTEQPLGRWSEVAGWAGLGLLVLSLALLNEHQPFPGWRAIGPVLATFLMIAAGGGAFVNRRVIASAPLQFIGRISYGAYLWHWPLLVFARFSFDGQTPAPVAFALMGVAIVLAALSERFIERPIRQGGGASLALPKALWGAMLGVAASSLVVTTFAAAKAPNTIMRLLNYPALEGDPWRTKQNCFTDLHENREADAVCSGARAPGKPHVVLWGDSHAAHLWPGLSVEAGEHGWSAGQFTASMCPPLVAGATNGNRHCQAIRDRSLATFMAPAPDSVVMAARWRLYDGAEILNQLAPTIRALREKGARRVVVIGPAPIWLPTLGKALVADMRRAKLAEPPLNTMTGFDTGAFAFEKRMRAAVEGAGGVYVSILDKACAPGGPCRAWVDEDRKTILTAFDAGHFTIPYSRWMAHELGAEIFVRAK